MIVEMPYRQTIKILLLILSATSIATAKQFQHDTGWRGLVPLHSTRADVERILGQPTEVLAPETVFYRTASETLIIRYSSGRPCGIGEKYSSWRVPRDTIESLLVSMITERSLSDLGIDEPKYTKWSGGHRPEDVYYESRRDGVSIRTYMGKVMDISLFPGSEDKALWCGPISSDCEGQPPRLMAVYGPMSWGRERLQLDRFEAVFNRNLNQTIYIIAYAGQSAYVGEGQSAADRAKKYLSDQHKVPSDQIIAIDGGYRPERKIELYLVPENACKPVPSPTVDPRDVRIIKSRNLRD